MYLNGYENNFHLIDNTVFMECTELAYTGIYEYMNLIISNLIICIIVMPTFSVFDAMSIFNHNYQNFHNEMSRLMTKPTK